MRACMLSRFSRVRLCATPWTSAHRAPLSTGFSRQEYWSGLPFPSPEPSLGWGGVFNKHSKEGLCSERGSVFLSFGCLSADALDGSKREEGRRNENTLREDCPPCPLAGELVVEPRYLHLPGRRLAPTPISTPRHPPPPPPPPAASSCAAAEDKMV